MSSSRPSEPAADASTPAAGGPTRRPLSLRSKLIIAIVAVITVVCFSIGLVTQLFLNRYLTEQKDQQLLAAQQRSMGFNDRREAGDGQYPAFGDFGPAATGGSGSAGIEPTPAAPTYTATAGTSSPPTDSPSTTSPGGAVITDGNPCGSTDDGRGRPSFLFLPGQSVGTLGAWVDKGEVVASGILDGPRTCTPIDNSYDSLLLAVPVDGNPHTISIDDADYRVLASAQRDGSTLITGLPMADVSQTQTRLTVIMFIVSGFALLAGGLVVFLIVRRSMRPLERMAGTARAVAELPLHEGEVDLGVRVPDKDTDPRTEIGQVGAALNQMLGHVSNALEARQASETRVRRFVADASHELRTPLAAIRGYAELAGRTPDDTPSVTHALRRVESESQRMTSLVDDLLLLARLDSGRPLADEEVDLTLLALDAVSDARVAGPDHRWRLDLPEDPVTVRGDQARLHQVLANLLANARTHTAPGSTVVTGLRDIGDVVEMTVTDDGEGIAASLQPEIFGRFVRGDNSRSRAAGSTGLGLAIVAAVTAAHHGTVDVRSVPGRTVFTVRLPRSGPPSREIALPDDELVAGPVTHPEPSR
jgi:two-component system OmpR family sensor kinase